MRFLLIVLFSVAVVSCGKSGGGSSGNRLQAQKCEVDGQAVSCDSIYDGLGVDILDASVDAPATVTNSSITFSQARSGKSDGRRISCSVSVAAGDVYRYSVNGDTLYLDTPTRNMTMKRVHGDGDGIVGTWKWSGIVDGATLETRLMTVVKNMSHVILKTSCER